MTNRRQYHTATLLRDGTVLAAGGHQSVGAGPLDTAEVYRSHQSR